MNYDLHMHLDLYKNRNNIITYIESSHQYTIAVTNLPSLFKKYIGEYSGLKYIRFALGYHPELIMQYPNQLSIFFKYANEAKYIGEVGLDFTQNNKISKDLQIEYFSRIIDHCKNCNQKKFITVHSRQAVNEVNNIIGLYSGTVVMHWFSGTLKQLEQSISNGYYFSVNSAMLQSKKGQEIISHIPLARLLIETDAPFTKDTQNSYDCSILAQIKSNLARLLQISNEKIDLILFENLKKAISI